MTATPSISLQISHRAYNGETAVVRLAGTVTLDDSNELRGVVRMLFANDYVRVVIDTTNVEVGNGGNEALLAAQKSGARLEYLEV